PQLQAPRPVRCRGANRPVAVRLLDHRHRRNHRRADLRLPRRLNGQTPHPQEYSMKTRTLSQLGSAALMLMLSAAALAQPVKETVSNPYGIDALWAQGDLVARGTLTLLVLFSLGSWYVLATKLVQSIKLAR